MEGVPTAADAYFSHAKESTDPEELAMKLQLNRMMQTEIRKQRKDKPDWERTKLVLLFLMQGRYFLL